jgi:hypothetical protein
VEGGVTSSHSATNVLVSFHLPLLMIQLGELLIVKSELKIIMLEFGRVLAPRRVSYADNTSSIYFL